MIATLIGVWRSLAQSIRSPMKPASETAAIATAGNIADLRTRTRANAPAIVQTAKLTPSTPNIGAQPDNQLSVWLYPMYSQGKPVNSQPRTHSVSTHSAGIIAR